MRKMLLALALLASAAQGADKVPTIKQSKLDATAAKWQHRLKLDDWDISVKLVRLSEFHVGAIGHSEWDVKLKEMRIEALDPRDYADIDKTTGFQSKAGKAIWKDIANTILHELVHLRLYDLMIASDLASLKTAEEVTVNRFVMALLAGER